MRIVPNGRGGLVELQDATHCDGCGEPFARGLFTLGGIRDCPCSRFGHRAFHCLRESCRAVTLDPPCARPDVAVQIPLEGHRR